jgi:hypothetical protein
MLTNAYIPYKGFYSSPFARWQGSMANEHSIVLVAKTAGNFLETRKISPEVFDYLILGVTVNNFGSSMIFGHPQAPTAGRLIIEGIEELAAKGGGYLLFTGCAAGDTGAALVLKIES